MDFGLDMEVSEGRAKVALAGSEQGFALSAAQDGDKVRFVAVVAGDLAKAPVSAYLCMSGLQVRWWMTLQGGLHLIRKALVRSVVGADLPSVLRLSLRLCVLGVVAVSGSAGVAGVAGVVARGVPVAVLVLLASLGRLGGVAPGGSEGGGWSPPSCWVLGGVASSVTGKCLHGA